MTKDEALKLSMEAMEITGGFDIEINVIKEALADTSPNFNCKSVQARLATAWGYVKTPPEQEPVAWRHKQFFETQEGWFYADWHSDGINPPSAELLYTTPPQRTWVGLTLDERIELAQDVDWAAGAYCEYAEKIESKLKEKNVVC